MKYLLDTNICIYLIKKRPLSVLTMLHKKKLSDVVISSVTVAELEHGVAKSERPGQNRLALMEFLTPYDVIPFDAADAVAFGEINTVLERAGKTIGPMDMLIAAQAVSRELILVSNNLREFSRVAGLKTENWAD